MPTTTTVALYVRITKDRAGRAESVADQERRGRAYASRTWPGCPVVVFADNAITAGDSDTERPGYAQLRDAIRAGRLGHVWAAEQTRLERTEIGWFELAADLVAADILEVHTGHDGIVRVGDEVAGIKAVLAAAELRRIQARVRAKHEALAAQGRPRGGREFGYRPGRDPQGRATLEVHEDEAAHVRWAAGAVLAGWSLSSVAEELNARGVPLPRGGRSWSTNQVRRTLTKGTIAGLRVHHGQVIGPARWEPILDRATWEQVRATLDIRATVTDRNGQAHVVTHTKRAARRHLLSGGVARCGLCDAPLIGTHRRVYRGGPLVPYYLCHPSKGGCARIGIKGEELEAHVAGVLLAELERQAAFGEALAEDMSESKRAGFVAAIAAVDARQVQLARRWAAGDVPAAAWDAARSDLDAERQRLIVELAELPPPAGRMDPAEVRDGWELMTVEERRHVVRLYVAAVRVGPHPGGPRSDPAGRATIVWRES